MLGRVTTIFDIDNIDELITLINLAVELWSVLSSLDDCVFSHILALDSHKYFILLIDSCTTYSWLSSVDACSIFAGSEFARPQIMISGDSRSRSGLRARVARTRERALGASRCSSQQARGCGSLAARGVVMLTSSQDCWSAKLADVFLEG
jgi:hypothetical protein